ncbi:MAG TPA: EthD family reductase [Chloroflexi bacterium]|nr:EthD family reductase [Chloroflexota bacterium]|tara:strand:- start:196 stop:543 length:348 start_codon:yes stop_codon:yes gene_type:complete
MYKMTILFNTPENINDFEERWSQQFIPIAEQMPGVQRITVSHIEGEPKGKSEYYKIHEFQFANKPSLDHALNSEKGVQAGKALMKFAGNITTILFSESFEEERNNNDLDKYKSTN